jgi:hypothetical protein
MIYDYGAWIFAESVEKKPCRFFKIKVEIYKPTNGKHDI